MNINKSLYLAILNNENIFNIDVSSDLKNHSCANCYNISSYLIKYKYHIFNPIHTGWFTICKICMNKYKTNLHESKKLLYFLKLNFSFNHIKTAG